MDSRQLEIFISVAQTLNFTKTAQELHLTQPAVSHQISELEKELDAKLLLRSSHQVILTSAGKEFFSHAKELIAAIRLAKSRTYDAAHGMRGNLRILTVQGCLETAVACITAFTKRYPDIKIEADVVTGAGQMASINRRDADVYISTMPLIDAFPQLEKRVLQRKQFSLLLPSTWDCRVDTRDFSFLKGVPLICERDTEAPYLVNLFFEICQNRGLYPENVYWCNSAISQLLMLKCGLGFSLSPSPSTDIFTDDLRVIPLEGYDALSEDALGWFHKTTNQAVGCFLEIVKELFPITADVL